MRKSLYILFTVLTLTQPIFAKTPAAHIVLVSVQRILEASHAFRKFQLMLEIKSKESEKKFMAVQKDLERKNNALISLQSTLPEQQWKEKKRIFDAEVSAFQKAVQDRRQELEGFHQKAILELQGHVQRILSKLSEKKGFSLAIDQQVTIWTSKETHDLTEDVITQLNENIPDLNVFSKEERKHKKHEETDKSQNE